MASASPLSPTFYGHITSTQDALLLFEACLSGALDHVVRRLHDRGRASSIKSGNVFIYEECSSGIKRWSDGVPWSPSRILGSFLVYRELERPFPPGEKKRAIKQSKRSPRISKATEPYRSSMSTGYGTVTAVNSYLDSSSSNSLNKEAERSLIGSLVGSYSFKEEGLVKKTISVTVGGVLHHLVSYYTVADVMNNKFGTPTKDPRFSHITPRPCLVTEQNFRTPIDDAVYTQQKKADSDSYDNLPRENPMQEQLLLPYEHSFRQLQLPPIYQAQEEQPPSVSSRGRSGVHEYVLDTNRYGAHTYPQMLTSAFDPLSGNPSLPYGYQQPRGQSYSGSDNNQRNRKLNFAKETTDKLRAWFVAHLPHPYPTEDEKQDLMRQTGLQICQISDWFINARRRPMF